MVKSSIGAEYWYEKDNISERGATGKAKQRGDELCAAKQID